MTEKVDLGRSIQYYNYGVDENFPPAGIPAADIYREIQFRWS